MNYEERINELKALLNNPTIKPSQREAIEQIINENGPVLTFEQFVMVIELIIAYMCMKK